MRDNLHDDSSLKHCEINAPHVPANAAKLNLHSALQARSLSLSLSVSLTFSSTQLQCYCASAEMLRKRDTAATSAKICARRYFRERRVFRTFMLPSLADASLRVIITGISSKGRRYVLTSR